MKTKSRLGYLAIAVMFGAACGQPDRSAVDFWEAASNEANGDSLNGAVLNGAVLNGAVLNGAVLNGAVLNGAVLNGAVLNGGAFSGIRASDGATISGSDFVGVRLTGVLSDSRQVDLRIDSISHDSTYNLDWYQVALSLDSGSTWGPLCAGGVGAVPLNNRWTPTGNLIVDSSMFTFACDNAALAKCRKWGYDPAATKQECNSDQECQDQSEQMWHQACTRMVRADYCGDGVVHTRNGTAIDIYDNLNIQTRSGDVGSIEADWSADGAHCIRKTRYLNATGAGSDYDYVFNTCPSRLAAQDSSCGGDPNSGPDSTDYSSQNGFSVSPSVRHLLRNDSVGNLQ